MGKSPVSGLIPRFRPPINYDQLPLDNSREHQWGKIHRVFSTTPGPRPFYRCRRKDSIPLTGFWRSPKLYHDLAYDKLGVTTKYPHLAAGVVNKIIQAPGMIVLGAVVSAGLAERRTNRGPPPPPENTLGSLVVLHHSNVYKIRAHFRTHMTRRGPAVKYYCVNDVAFNPHNTSQFLSTGHDFSAQVWVIPDNDIEATEPQLVRTISFKGVPEEVAYNADDSVLAIPSSDGLTSLYRTSDVFEDGPDTPIALGQFQVAPNKMNQGAGAIAWGIESSSHLLFTSSEPNVSSPNEAEGYHRAWDTRGYQMAFELDAKEEGDCLTISPDGSTLLLITSGHGSSHPLRLYDIRRRISNAYAKEELEPFQVRASSVEAQSGPSEWINCAIFSPDGRLFTVARNDNRVHVYDVRAVSKGPLCKFEHHESDVGNGGCAGVVDAQWVEGRDRRRLGIISGGSDGCVRLWEPSLAPYDRLQGTVIGRTDFEVAQFSIGDGWEGEIPMLIGDSGGGLLTYDLVDEDGCPIERHG